MPRTFEDAFEQTTTAIRGAIARMANAVPAPKRTHSARGELTYRYVEQHTQQALVLKSVRTLSALVAGKLLLDRGLTLDAGATMRILDELGSDIMFLSGPLLMGKGLEPRHAQFLTEFFQEEFDHADPLQSSQRRNRVSRRDIRAYVARTFHAGAPVSRVVDVTETIDNAFSGFVHGAGVHTMDVYDGTAFHVPLQPDDRPLISMLDQYSQYTHRALMAVATAAKSVGDEDLFQELYQLQGTLFNEYGDVR